MHCRPAFFSVRGNLRTENIRYLVQTYVIWDTTLNFCYFVLFTTTKTKNSGTKKKLEMKFPTTCLTDVSCLLLLQHLLTVSWGETVSFFFPDQRKMQSHSRSALACQGLHARFTDSAYICGAAYAHLASQSRGQYEAPLIGSREGRINSPRCFPRNYTNLEKESLRIFNYSFLKTPFFSNA